MNLGKSMRKGLIDGIATLASLLELSARSIELSSRARTSAARVADRPSPALPGRVPASATVKSSSTVSPETARPADVPRVRSSSPPSSPDASPSQSPPVSRARPAEADAGRVKNVASDVQFEKKESESPISTRPTSGAAEPGSFAPTSPPKVTFSAVPSTRLGRLFHYGGLAADVGFGALSQTLSKGVASDDGTSTQYPLSEASVRRLVSRMSRMRGAALKIGQFASMQGAKILPPQIEEILIRVQHSAHFMPDWQVQDVLAVQLGTDWKDKFREFDLTPMAAASIGQVHRAQALDGSALAVKVQFPGVAKSVQSDIRNIALLLQAGALLPKGLFLENSLSVLGRELADECDYRREAAFGEAFRVLLRDDDAFAVPAVQQDLSSEQVLTTHFATGRTLHNVDDLSQGLRDEIGTKILRLCLREIFHFRLMQTDPNWSNFLWQADRHEIELIDFGAGRRYKDAFIDRYLGLLRAAISGDRETCVELSRAVGYLTGKENQAMEEAHYQSMAALGEPFHRAATRPFSFRDQTITDRVRAQVPIMLRHRLTPPPQETYSLNRKLSGCFLLCARLGSRIDCVGMLEEVLASREEEKREADRRLSPFGARLD